MVLLAWGGGLEALSKSKVVFPFSVCLRKASSRNSMLSNTFRPRIPNLSNPNSADPSNPRIPRPSSPILTCGDLGREILFCAKRGERFTILNLYFARSAEKILRFFQYVPRLRYLRRPREEGGEVVNPMITTPSGTP